MSYFEDQFEGYVGREEYTRAPEPTFKQIRTLEKLATTKKLTTHQQEALNALLCWYHDR